MPLTVESAYKTEFLDTAHYDVVLDFSGIHGFTELNDIVVADADGLVPFVIVDGELKTQTFSFTCYVTERQEALLRSLYTNTVHTAYIDQRYPISVSWGHGSAPVTKSCYISAYEPPIKVDYSKADILGVSFSLRPI